MKLLVAFLCLLTAGLAAEDITWLRLDAPPYYILQGPLADRGIADRITRLLASALPEYDHRFVSDLPLSRIASLQKAGEKVALVTVLRSPEREEYLAFSLPTVINPPYALVTTAAKSSRFGATENLSLRALLARPDVVIGVSDRVYGEPIDSLLKAHSANPRLVRRMGTNVFTSLLQMVEANRVDFIIGSPYEVAFARSLTGAKNEIYTYGLEEVRDQYLLSYAAFPKTPWGLALRDKVNTVLVRQRKTDGYRALFTEWLDPRSVERLRGVWPKLMETE